MNTWAPLEVKVWGEFACFTRPEMKVERVTYPVMTPSAARGILEAIFWKPEFRWRISEIWVLNPIRHISFMRNEINSRQTHRAQWISDGGGYYADEDRAQRHTLALRGVAYVIRADVAPLEPGLDAQAKYRDQFRRRVQRGQCLHRPYLGCREFAAEFGEPQDTDQPLEDLTDDLGLVLGEMDYAPDGSGTPRFFHARVEKGVLRVPQEDVYGKGGEASC